MGKSQRKRQPKACDYCEKLEAMLYRIRLQQSEPWLLVCSDCQTKVKTQSLYQYGGTWKQIKRH
jgi:hypothetical protein